MLLNDLLAVECTKIYLLGITMGFGCPETWRVH